MKKTAKPSRDPFRTLPGVADMERRLSESRQLAAFADRYVDQVLFAVANGVALEDNWCEALEALAKMSSHYNGEDFAASTGDAQCACYDAGIAMGLAFGLRLRGVR